MPDSTWTRERWRSWWSDRRIRQYYQRVRYTYPIPGPREVAARLLRLAGEARRSGLSGALGYLDNAGIARRTLSTAR